MELKGERVGGEGVEGTQFGMGLRITSVRVEGVVVVTRQLGEVVVSVMYEVGESAKKWRVRIR